MARVTVVGTGVAGSYLGARLALAGIDVEGVEAQDPAGYRSVCAWATSLEGMRERLRQLDVDMEDYVLVEARGISVDLGGTIHEVPTRHLVTFDKPALIRRLMGTFRVRHSVRARGIPGDASGLVVDATGVHRAVIGPARSGTEFALPAYQLRVRYRNPPMESFYVRPFPRYSGYLWYFPLGGGEFFVGAGDLHHMHLRYLSEFLDEHRPDEVLSREGRPIRISPPGILEPISRSAGAAAVVAVGEAAGAVLPILGEGILPSVESAELLAEILLREGVEGFSADRYEGELRRRFSAFRAAYRFVRRKQAGTCRASDPSCLADAARLALFFSSRWGRRLTGIAPGPEHVWLALRPF
ncbi:MAG: NAD(P)/FAD-dependent oxidoreductase [Conexivisphaera sp.]